MRLHAAEQSVLSERTQNDRTELLSEYQNSYIRNLSIVAIENMLSIGYDHAKWNLLIQFFSTAFVAFIVRWGEDGMQEEPAVLITKIWTLFDGSVLRELEGGARKRVSSDEARNAKEGIIWG